MHCKCVKKKRKKKEKKKIESMISLAIGILFPTEDGSSAHWGTNECSKCDMKLYDGLHSIQGKAE